jgi:membrane-associated phospholipid phosphatase
LRFIVAVLLLCLAPVSARALPPELVLQKWYGLVLQLVRHTPTYSPPVASRAFAYLGVTAFEANGGGLTLAGQLNDLKSMPTREQGKVYDDAVVLHAALSLAAQNFFSNTGPSGQNALKAKERKLLAEISQGIATDVLERSEDYGHAVAEAVLEWSKSDGGAVVENLGFPMTYELAKAPGHWVPTSKIALQQHPLLPTWGKNRPFAMSTGAACSLPPPPEFSEDKNSEFFKQAQEVYDISKSVTPEQKAIARFWSDDPMLSPTPPGHWISIALQLFEKQKTPINDQVDVLARLGIAEADAFIGCWTVKYQYDFLRPVTIIKKSIDAKWESLLITPPFPEYPSGHSTQSAAAAAVLTQYFGENFAFDDATHIRDGIKPRHFESFSAAAEEAAISRLYGGIHFRSAVEQGLVQGRCIGAYATGLKTQK